jgi:hypothetical protein
VFAVIFQSNGTSARIISKHMTMCCMPALCELGHDQQTRQIMRKRAKCTLTQCSIQRANDNKTGESHCKPAPAAAAAVVAARAQCAASPNTETAKAATDDTPLPVAGNAAALATLKACVPWPQLTRVHTAAPRCALQVVQLSVLVCEVVNERPRVELLSRHHLQQLVGAVVQAAHRVHVLQRWRTGAETMDMDEQTSKGGKVHGRCCREPPAAQSMNQTALLTSADMA